MQEPEYVGIYMKFTIAEKTYILEEIDDDKVVKNY